MSECEMPFSISAGRRLGCLICASQAGKGQDLTFVVKNYENDLVGQYISRRVYRQRKQSPITPVLCCGGSLGRCSC